MAKSKWPKEVLEMMQWVVDESKEVCQHIELTFGVKPSPAEQNVIARAIFDGIRESLLRKERGQ